jgi:predicted small lipoprotein YifL
MLASWYWETDVQPQERIRLAPAAAALAMLGICGGCHQKPPPVATPADVAAAQQEAQHEVEQAKIEAKKDVKSAAKVMGVDSKDVARARVTGAFDIAMAHADGDHKVAIETCMTLAPAVQASCKDQADTAYQSAVAKAKALRVSQQQ